MNLHTRLAALTDNISVLRQNRKGRIDWAKASISGKVISKYMIDCLMMGDGKCPWK